MTGLYVALALSVFAMATAAQAAPAKAVVTNPDWVVRPSGKAMGEAYPKLAARLDISGYVALSCTVNTNGTLAGCVAIDEAPRNLGFSEAALEVSRTFRMSPLTVNGKPVDGGTVRIPLRFTLPADEETPALPAASEAAVREAGRFVDAMGAVPKEWDQIGRALEAEGERLPSATRAAAIKSLRDAFQAHETDIRNAYAAAFASVFTVEELTALADFAMGPGQPLNENTTIQSMLELLKGNFRRNARDAARSAFCATRVCGTAQNLAAIWRPSDANDDRLDNPQWAAMPTESALSRVVPRLAASLGLAAAVRMTCDIDGTGRANNCKVDDQLPAGMGYGAAAQAIAYSYRLSPIQLDAGAATRKVTVRVGFSPSVLPDAFDPPKARSERALATARQMLSEEEAAKTSQRDVELQILDFEAQMPRDADPAVWADAVAAFRKGGNTAIAQNLDQRAHVLAAELTDEQLAALLTFRTSAAGRAQRDMQEQLTVMLTNARKLVGVKITADAKAAFCKVQDCTSRTPQDTATSPEPSTRKP